jgi:hypothetical protein
VRLQLRPARSIAAALALGTVAWVAAAPPASANSEGAARVTYFREPSTSNAGITVVHPQLDVAAALGSSFNLNAGYEVDIVTGASPKTFGPTKGVDAVDAVSQATHFSDTRHQVKGGFDFSRPSSGLSAGYSYGWESDYRSHSISASSRSDLLDHNFTLAFAYTHNFDSVCDANNSAVEAQPLELKPLSASTHCFQSTMTDVTSHRLNIDTFEPSLTWTASPRLLLQGGTTVQVLDGFQSNPYRSVRIGSQHRTPQEHMPQYRQRYAIFGRAAYALPDLRASLMATVRFYRDSWAVQATTADLNFNKYLAPQLLVNIRGRYHRQSEASFYRSGIDYVTRGPAGQYWTGDRELSPMSNYLVGGKLAYLKRPEQEKTFYSEIELAFRFEGLFYRLAPDAPNSDRTHALIFQGAFALRF